MSESRCYGFGDWEPPPKEQQQWQHFLHWLNRDMHLRGLVGVRPFPDAVAALDYTTRLVNQAGLAVRLTHPVVPAIRRQRGQFVLDLGVDTGKGPELVKRHKLVFAWDVVSPEGTAVAYVQIS